MNDGKKFDVILMNPPYDKNLHLKFLEKTIEIADNVVSIQPITNFQKSYVFNQKSDMRLTSIDVLSIEDSNKYFSSAHIRQNLGIILYNANDLKSIDDLQLFDNEDIIKKCKNYMSNNSNLRTRLKTAVDDSLSLKFCYGATLFGHGKITKATFRVCSIDYDLATSKKKVGHVIYLNDIPNETIRFNIYKFYNSIYMRLWMKTICFAETQYKLVPFLGFDKYNTRWVENDYKNFFMNEIGFTLDEWNLFNELAKQLPE